MPDFETMDLTEKAVVLLYLGFNDRHGQPAIGPPIEINVRWNWGQRQALTPAGELIALEATVIAAVDIPLLSHLWLGPLADFVGTGSNDPEPGVMEVKTYKRVRDLKGRATRYEYGTMRWHGQGS